MSTISCGPSASLCKIGSFNAIVAWLDQAVMPYFSSGPSRHLFGARSNGDDDKTLLSCRVVLLVGGLVRQEWKQNLEFKM